MQHESNLTREERDLLVELFIDDAVEITEVKAKQSIWQTDPLSSALISEPIVV